MDSEIIMYQTDDGSTKIETTFDGDTVWLSIDQMAELFQRDRSVIGKHIRNIFKKGELERNSLCGQNLPTLLLMERMKREGTGMIIWLKNSVCTTEKGILPEPWNRRA
ncbi:hypothetical protein ABDB91_01575 [Desulfoscipio sp. XC116]|uniref:hypothetical protein n=1 Tax=Desulfoscipio sp. XC116 TaxID=3144975 RepID=UPI00325BA903